MPVPHAVRLLLRNTRVYNGDKLISFVLCHKLNAIISYSLYYSAFQNPPFVNLRGKHTVQDAKQDNPFDKRQKLSINC